MPSNNDRRHRRSYGSGSLHTRVDRAGREAWYGTWWTHGRQIKRRIGAKRGPGGREGLTRRQAEAELRRLISETPGRRPATERLTVAEVGQRYLTHLENTGRKASTIAAVKGHLEHWHSPFFADRSIDSIRPEDVSDLMSLMRAGHRPGGLKRTKPLSPKTIHNAIGTLNALLRFAQRKRWASFNAVAEVELPAAEPNDDIRFLEPNEVEALARAATPGPYQPIDRALYLTAAMTGLRAGELVALRWRDVDWTAARIRVRQNHVLGEFGTPKSRRSTRSVPMADPVAAELERLFQQSRWQADDDLVFADPTVEAPPPHGAPLGKASILKRFRKALKAARLETTHVFHDLRHTFGTQMAAHGVPIRTIQEWMGHKDIQTTQRYADYAPSTHEAAVVAAAFGRGNNRGNNLSEPERTGENENQANTGVGDTT